ncbi:LptA/OstA family protein [Acetohalobium arabaticum]|uniref:OstA family protein n=1 Tax=Acetohalobium arabaticum (strain ATCC 49924 / DSM 5501 / Z-7288) TaxID=574087 RepID=D9QTU4_ACEAZ|nr:LptA/OstA family protein [Acetohalobium arabaticum]ADL13665.1 OstA family protein [Acetohalobium arabaticum DSM 5501]
MLLEKSKLLPIVLFSLAVITVTSLAGAKEAKEAGGEMEILADEMILEKKSIVATGNVEVNSSQGRMTGDRFEVDNEAETGLMTGDPPVLVSQGWQVTGKRLEIDFAAEEVFVPQKAHLQSDTMEADAEQMRILYQKRQAVLTGDVVVVNQERRLTGQKVTIDLETERMSSKGRTKLTLPSSDLESESETNDN